MAWAWHGKCETDTAALCKSIEGIAGERHGHDMLCVNRPLVLQYGGQTLIDVDKNNAFLSEDTTPSIFPAQSTMFNFIFLLITTCLHYINILLGSVTKHRTLSTFRPAGLFATGIAQFPKLFRAKISLRSFPYKFVCICQHLWQPTEGMNR